MSSEQEKPKERATIHFALNADEVSTIAYTLSLHGHFPGVQDLLKKFKVDDVTNNLNVTGDCMVEKVYKDKVFTHCVFTNANMHNTHFATCRFVGCKFENVNLISCHFTNVVFEDCEIDICSKNPQTSILSEVSFVNCDIARWEIES